MRLKATIPLRFPFQFQRAGLRRTKAVGVDDLRGKLAVGNDPTPQPEGGSRLMT